MDESPVKVYIYDISRGFARTMSQALLGRQLDGVWHTGIVVYGQEFFFGGDGISSCNPGGTILGQPDSVVDLGVTHIPFEVLMSYLEDLSQTSFRPECYHLLEHNCNNFSNELAQFLTGQPIPSYIINLPNEVMQTPFGAMIKQFLDTMSVNPGGHRLEFHSNPPASGAGARSPPAAAKSAPPAASPPSLENITFEDKECLTEFEKHRSDLQKNLSEKDYSLMSEVHEFLTTKDCSWSLGQDHICCLLHLHSELPATQPRPLRLLQEACLQEDVVRLLEHDKSKAFLSLLQTSSDADPISLGTLAKCVCNCSSFPFGREFLLKKDQFKLDSSMTSHHQLMCSLCTLCLLHEEASLNHLGAVLAHIITSEAKLDSEVAIEIGIALVQLTLKGFPESAAEHILPGIHSCLDADDEVARVALCMELDIQSLKTSNDQLQPHFKAIQAKLRAAAS